MPDQTIDLDDLNGGSPRTPAAPELVGRYTDQARIAIGGMGEVRRVYDHTLKRTLAMKIIRWSLIRHAEARSRFFEEARITARLQHPGIVAIHDVGELEDGRLWYTMPEVHGSTFTQVIAALHGSDVQTRWKGWNTHRLLSAFQRACSAVAYAHSQGVIHRDIKPDNLMIGPFDETLVMDWGISAVHHARSTEPQPKGERTLGTPAYMPPEQATGDTTRQSPASDVYALGVCLYEILTGQLPWQVPRDVLMFRLRSGEIPDRVPLPAQAAPPPVLLQLFERAISRDPADRPASAAEFSMELQAWLDGSSRRRRALEVVGEACTLLPEITTLRSQADTMRQEADVLLAALRPHDPIDAKAPAWAVQDQVAALESRIAHLETRYLHTLRSALSHEPTLAEAHDRLAALYCDRLQAAEQRGDSVAVARLEVFLRAHDRGRHAALLEGRGTLSLTTDPPGALVTLLRYTERTRQLVGEPFGEPITTPIDDLSLPAGSYLVCLEADGCTPVRYPVDIKRGAHWRSTPPGQQLPAPVWLPAAEAIGAGEVIVPAGWFRSGGDSEAIDGLSARWLWINDLIVCQHPVTNRDYIAWLDALWVAGRHDEARRHCPASQNTEAESRPAYRQSPDGHFHPGDLPGNWGLDAPVVLIDWADAMAYAQHRAVQTGLPWRLLHGQEWEKAARGVDGRRFPWGDHFDPRRACMARSQPGRPSRASITDYPDDESPYGVRGMAGNTRDWCINPYLREGPASEALSEAENSAGDDRYRMSRGGSWSSSNHTLCRAASRFAGPPDLRLVSMGFRLARPAR